MNFFASDKGHRKKIYYAAPLFSEAEAIYNVEVAARLDNMFDVYLPQRDGGTVSELVKQGVLASHAKKTIFARDLQALAGCDLVLAVLDGRSIDEGVSFELGFAYARGIRCVGLQTDVRRFSFLGNNPMIDGCLDRLFKSVEELIGWALEYSVGMSVTSSNERKEHQVTQCLRDSDRNSGAAVL